jgi:predicted MPP superfamily phosphohydrolase
MIKRLRQYWKSRTSRRRFLLGSMAGGAGAMGATYGYMRLWESGWLEVNHHQVPVEKPVAPFRLLHLSDLHASKVVSLGYLRRALSVGLEQKPDLICVTGDFITWKYKRYGEYAEVLRVLSATAPTYACLGNHDGGVWAESKMKTKTDSTEQVRQLLQNANIRLLHNEHVAKTVNGHEWNVVGVGDLWNRECLPDLAFARMDPARPTLVLSHNPDSKDLMANHPWDVMLCGHTHGGQIYLPGLGAPLAPVKNKKYVRGLHRLGDRWLHVTKGVGNLHGVRLNCRPEVSVLDVS